MADDKLLPAVQVRSLASLVRGEERTGLIRPEELFLEERREQDRVYKAREVGEEEFREGLGLEEELFRQYGKGEYIVFASSCLGMARIYPVDNFYAMKVGVGETARQDFITLPDPGVVAYLENKIPGSRKKIEEAYRNVCGEREGVVALNCSNSNLYLSPNFTINISRRSLLNFFPPEVSVTYNGQRIMPTSNSEKYGSYITGGVALAQRGIVVIGGYIVFGHMRKG